LAKSKAAMSQPLRYTEISKSGRETVVYQKTLPNGSIAVLMSDPATKRIDIIYDKTFYKIRLEHQIAIDMTYMSGGANDQTDSLFSDLEDTTPRKSYELVGIVRYNDTDWYEILEIISPVLRAAMLERLPENIRSKIRAKSRILIDKETYLKQAEEDLTEEGTIISKTEYKDYCPQPDLSDDFFQLPPGLEVLTPRSSKEYVAILMDRRTPTPPPVTAETEKSRAERERLEAELERIRAEQERVIAEMERVKAESDKKWQEELAAHRAAMERLMEREYYPLPEVSKNRWIFVVSVNVIVILLWAVVWWMFRKRKK
jgi:hypothetical protein